MTTPKAKVAGLALIAALCGGFTLGLTAPAWAGLDEAEAAYQRGDYATAIGEFFSPTKEGIADAQHNLGLMYGNGQGVPEDYVQAHMWFNLAASRYPPGEYRDISVKSRDIVVEKMTPAQISEAQKLAREWRPKK